MGGYRFRHDLAAKRRKHNVGCYFLDTTIISADFPMLIWDRKDTASNIVSDIRASQTQNRTDSHLHCGNIQTNRNLSCINTHHEVHDIQNQHLSNISELIVQSVQRDKYLKRMSI
eukprot:TRINITY_DN18596_c0_g1_i1.p1 TRINITY_DN18596_c0_g1~~TRINITY_DN18596_c0_g1_i1.p1  ORF type:complete len:115 (+),score=6.55 TRINITY_DN18596_c0_g1_i1:232-576(+)